MSRDGERKYIKLAFYYYGNGQVMTNVDVVYAALNYKISVTFFGFYNRKSDR